MSIDAPGVSSASGSRETIRRQPSSINCCRNAEIIAFMSIGFPPVQLNQPAAVSALPFSRSQFNSVAADANEVICAAEPHRSLPLRETVDSDVIAYSDTAAAVGQSHIVLRRYP